MKWKHLPVLCCAIITAAPLFGQFQSPYSTEAFVAGSDSLAYRKLLPQDFSADQSYPLVLFLHGAGERGSDNAKQLTHGSRLFTNPITQGAYPAVVLFPQCPDGDYWSQVDVDRSTYPIGLDFNYDKDPTLPLRMVMRLVRKYMDEPYIDTSRVYVMGLSMGGMGTFEILYRMPHTFAAAVPICGGGDPESVSAYAEDTALWIYHGGVDQVVGPDQSLEMFQALFEAGARPGFTMYPQVNHNSWDYAFAEDELLPWLFSHRKSNP